MDVRRLVAVVIFVVLAGAILEAIKWWRYDRRTEVEAWKQRQRDRGSVDGDVVATVLLTFAVAAALTLVVIAMFGGINLLDPAMDGAQ